MKAEPGLYEVTGNRAYRGHQPGAKFEARLEPMAEQRALVRGDIRLLERVTPAVPPGSYRLPSGWADETSSTDRRQ